MASLEVSAEQILGRVQQLTAQAKLYLTKEPFQTYRHILKS